MTTYALKRGDLAPWPRAQLVGGGGPVNLAGAAVRFLARSGPDLKVAAAAVVEDPAGNDGELGWVHYEPAPADSAAVGTWLAEWEVTFAGGAVQSFPGGSEYDLLVVTADLDAAGSLTAEDLAWLRDEVGDADPSTAQLGALYDELGNRVAVALRVLKRRRAALVASSSSETVTLSGVVSVSTSSSRGVADLDRQIARLEALLAVDEGVPVAGARVGRIVRRTARG